MAALWLVLAACSRTSEIAVVLDSSAPTRGLEVVAVPVDPATLRRPEPPPPAALPRRTADSVARWRRLADSAAALDAIFQGEREALNAEALALRALDRRGADYARRYDAFRRRQASADSLRAARDRLRRSAEPLRARLADHVPAGTLGAPDTTRWPPRAMLDTLADGARHARSAPLAGGRALLPLRPGVWFLGVTEAGRTPLRFTRLEVARGKRDTVRLAR